MRAAARESRPLSPIKCFLVFRVGAYPSASKQVSLNFYHGSITVAPAGKQTPSTVRGLPYTVRILGKAYADVTVGEVMTALAAKYPKLYVDGQKLAVAGSKAPLESDVKLSVMGVQNGGEVLIQDLGPQIG
ncbi:hypothetical protein FIBSPDRAFT_952786 [Athelia psychrophila]|uniref:Uncharacterized protein n=1 Tax=Athelia psychrophila TaxID=1759441 RepID=A0A166L8G4_9AGAM|nr:hypothetical protein FIBSPDRAFT_952786 [Fibularhizoctonia sp. CBS 109695]